MASALRTKAPIRTAQSLSATAVKLPAASVAARNLHMTGAREASPALVSFENMVADVPKRGETAPGHRKFNTSRSHKAVNDSSTVDFAYMPEVSFANPASADIRQIPLLPDNHSPQRASEHIAAAVSEPPVQMPEISTTTLVSDVSAFTEADANKAADAIGLVETKGTKQKGMVKQLFSDMLDDLLSGELKPRTA